MRRVAAAVLIMLFAASFPAVALPTPSPGPFLAHAPILVEGDANFTAANGVVAGNGTSGDPYVIAGWSIQARGSVGIRLHNVTKAFVVRDNSIAASVGIQVEEAAGAGRIDNNKLVVYGTGVSVIDADPLVANNSFVGDASIAGYNTGVALVRSNARVESNAFIYTPIGVNAEQGSPTIACNDIHDDTVVNAVRVHLTTNATIACNTLSSCQGGIVSTDAIGTVIVNNSVDQCIFGIDVTLTKDATVRNNTVRLSTTTQLNLWHASGVVEGNVLVDGRADAVVMDHSPLLLANNTIQGHAGAGIRLVGSSGDVEGNLVARNSVGIQLQAGSVPHLRANVMTNNTVGLDVPYASAQAIAWMSGNVVNGANVDGTLVASERVFYYRAANVTVSGGVRDSGFSAGYYGSVSAQGALVLYEVDTATVTGTLVGHANVGVHAVNSFNVVVQGASIVQTGIGVWAEAVPMPTPVPPCVVSVKDTNVTIPVDPVGTVGILATQCRINVLRTSVSLVDTGIKVDAGSPTLLANVTVRQASVGLDLVGAPDALNVSGSLVAQSRIGVLASSSRGDFVDNRVEGNAQAGLLLASGANLRLLGNRFTGNGAGVVDTMPCGVGYTCSKVRAEGNLFADNLGDGARVNGSSSFRGDQFLRNRGDGARLGSATLRDVVASDNDVDGVDVRGSFDVRGSAFERNGRHGATLVGGGALRESAFRFNDEAGIRLFATYVTAYDLNVSRNFDGILFDEAPSVTTPAGPVPAVSAQTVWGLLGAYGAGPLQGPDPLDIHHSVLAGNERDGIRAGGAVVNATSNYWGTPTGPAVSVADQVGAYRNGVSPSVRFLPYYEDADMTTVGPAPSL